MRGPGGIGHAEMAVSRKEDPSDAESSGAVSGFLRKLGLVSSSVLNEKECKSFGAFPPNYLTRLRATRAGGGEGN